MPDSGRRGPDTDVRSETPFPSDVEQTLRAALRDRYVIEREIGRGGMGVVFRARDLKHERTVAIKVLRPDIARYRGPERFLTEIRTAARLTHPHIVTVFDSGDVDGLMYYVMPFVEGESLRGLLQRSGKLEPAIAAKIAGQIASALQYAHDLGVVHRDIKPENILLSDGHAWLADFGVARALALDIDLHLTATGQLLGSPLYSSPENSGGAGDVDGRTDIYSLGCVLYEMLTGSPPFTGKTMQAVLMRHHTEKPESLSRTRPGMPAALDDVVQTAMAKRPEQRFANAAGFESALARAIGGGSPARWRPRVSRRAVGITAAVGAFAVIVVVAVPRIRDGIGPSTKASVDLNGPALDATRYVILPFVIDSGLPQLHAEERMADGLRSWHGIDVVDPSRTIGTPVTTDSQAAVVARQAGAGRFVRGSIRRMGDSMRVYVELGDGNRPKVNLTKVTRIFAINPSRSEHYFNALSDSLLLRGIALECLEGGTGTHSLRAVQFCDAAFSALDDGELAITDTAFASALGEDPKYARAAVWLAETRSWIVAQSPDTRTLVAQASADSLQLTHRERGLLRARQLLNNNQFKRACGEYRDLVGSDQQDYVAWLGIGECHRRDRIVLPDSGNPSGWAFRSSYHQAVQGYRRAFELHPQLIGGYRARSFAPIRELLLTTTTSFREGTRLDAEGVHFRAYPEIFSDTLAFSPLPIQQFSQGQEGSWPPTSGQAVDRQRDLMRALASYWVTKLPNSTGAAEGLAVALEISGDATAITVIRKARESATSSDERFRLATSEFWLRLKFHLPSGRREIEEARMLGDSLLRATHPQNGEEARRLANIAIVLGEGKLAAALARQTAPVFTEQYGLASGIVASARALLVFASLGSYPDSLDKLEKEIDLAIQNTISARRDETRRLLFTQAAMVAYPHHVLDALFSLSSVTALVDAEIALAKNDTASVRRILALWHAGRQNARPADLTIDALYVESWLLAATGSNAEAISRLDPSLNAMRWYPPGRMDDLVRAGTLVHAMHLRYKLACHVGDEQSARKWSVAISVLWARADSELRQRYQWPKGGKSGRCSSKSSL